MIADTRAGAITSQPPASDKAIQVSATDEPAAELIRHEEGLLLKTGPIDAGMVWPVLTPLRPGRFLGVSEPRRRVR